MNLLSWILQQLHHSRHMDGAMTLANHKHGYLLTTHKGTALKTEGQNEDWKSVLFLSEHQGAC